MRIATIVLLLLANTTAGANTFIWQDQGMIQNDSAVSARSSGADVSPLQQYRRLTLDEAALRKLLMHDAQPNVQTRTSGNTLSLPLPNGSFATVTATRSDFAPALTRTFPDIQTWTITSPDNPMIRGVMDIGPNGFHAMLTLPNGDSVFIDPVGNNKQWEYRSFSKQENPVAFQPRWQCSIHATSNFRPDLSNAGTRTMAAKAGETLHTYDIAIATTAEYTNARGDVTKASQSIITTLSRVNEIFKRDLAIQLNVVNDTSIIYTDTNTDGYTHGDTAKLKDENITNLAKEIGNANYDVGHVFDHSNNGGDGIAYLGRVCDDGWKGGGATATDALGDTFAIDFLAHELGHQFGATHTFNQCYFGSQREAATAYEPGSGSTIMGYAGLCGSNNIQTNSDDMFHAASIAQITAFAHNGAGASCTTASPLINSKTTLNNSNPVVNAGADFTVTIGQAITLNGSATDADGDTLSYSWEQMDAGSPSAPGVDTGNNALIRAHLPTNDPTRTITTSLPTTNRTLNFRLVARDQQGGVGFDDVRVTVSGTSSGGGGSSGGGDGSSGGTSGGGGGGSIPLAGLLAGGAYWLVRRRKGVKA